MIDAKPGIINGAIHSDERGTLSFFNDLNIDEAKRFYIIRPSGIEIVRAWQGHKYEQKWFFATAGGFKIVTVKIDNWDNPSAQCELLEFDLKGEDTKVLHIPGGHATGIKATEPNSALMIFSDFTVQQSIDDDFRFSQDLWFDWGKV
jgi:dTDP-4-dehydrorhamnose 3,5-epimerase-like enzyme